MSALTTEFPELEKLKEATAIKRKSVENFANSKGSIMVAPNSNDVVQLTAVAEKATSDKEAIKLPTNSKVPLSATKHDSGSSLTKIEVHSETLCRPRGVLEISLKETIVIPGKSDHKGQSQSSLESLLRLNLQALQKQ
jgi:hypothetical protein